MDIFIVKTVLTFKFQGNYLIFFHKTENPILKKFTISLVYIYKGFDSFLLGGF